MSSKARLGLVAVAIAVAVAAFVLARPDDEDEDETAAPATTAEQQSPQTDPEEPPPAPEPRVDRLRVRGGEPVGGVKRLKWEKGDVVRLVVTADAPEHVHVHGYDLFRDVGPNQTARFRFEADIEGIFEIELEDSHTQIAELRVEP